MYLTAAFYWDLNDKTRAWSKKFAERYPKVPTMIHAGTYGAVMHYLKAVAAAGTDDGGAVAAKMKEMPVDDFMTTGGVIRADGRWCATCICSRSRHLRNPRRVRLLQAGRHHFRPKRRSAPRRGRLSVGEEKLTTTGARCHAGASPQGGAHEISLWP
jgi:hypothetical protein